jgi:chromosome transmission fidelity protein 1
LGIDLKGQIVVVDEAHNLMSSISDAIAQILSHRMLSHADYQLKTYRDKYEDRLKPKKRRYIHEVHRIVRMVLGMLKNTLGEEDRKSPMRTPQNHIQTWAFGLFMLYMYACV